jgi:hypothetical protein
MARMTLTLVLLLVLMIPVRASEIVLSDGPWWSQLSLSQKRTAVLAAQVAYTEGYVDGYSLVAVPGSAAWKFAVRHSPSFSHSIGYYIAAITDFYDKYPQGARVDIGAVMTCLSDNPIMSCANVVKYYRGYHKE